MLRGVSALLVDLIHDLRYISRFLATNRSFGVLYLATAGLGIGATVLAFAIVDSAFLRVLPFERSEQLVQLWGTRPEQNESSNGVAPAEYLDIERQQEVFERMTIFRPSSGTAAFAHLADEIRGAQVSDGFFAVFRISPESGRFFGKGDEALALSPVVISDALWKRLGRTTVLGEVFNIDGKPFTIVGVAPKGFGFPAETNYWIPFFTQPSDYSNRIRRDGGVVARLRPEASLDAARQALDVIGVRLAQAYPQSNKGHGLRLIGLRDEVTGDTRGPVLLLCVAALLVLLVACVNLTHLTLARQTNRRSELAIRVALGADRTRLVRQLMTESLFLGVLGGGLGVLMAATAIDLTKGIAPPGMPGLGSLSINRDVLLFSLAASLIAGGLAGILPACRLAQTHVSGLSVGVLSESRASASERKLRLAAVLVATQLCVTVALLTPAMLMMKGFWRLTSAKTGFDPHNVVSLRACGPRNGSARLRIDWAQRLGERIFATGGIHRVAMTDTLPYGGGYSVFQVLIDGVLPADTRSIPSVRAQLVSPTFFDTLAIPILQGRGISERDTGGTARVAVVNKAMADRFWPGLDVPGRILQGAWDDPPLPPVSVIGVSANVRDFRLDAGVVPQVYLPYAQLPARCVYVLAKADADPGGTLGNVIRNLSTIEPRQVISEAGALEDLAGQQAADPKFRTTVFGVLCGLAMILTVVGVYGVVSFSVAMRTREIAIRVAMGASRSDVLTLVIGSAARVVVVGLGLGIGSALLTSRLFETFLYGVPSRDLPIFILVPALVGVAALVATYIPARRALRPDTWSVLNSQ